MISIGFSTIFPDFRNFDVFQIVDKISIPKVALVFASVLGFGYLRYRKNALNPPPPSLPFTELLKHCAEPLSEHLSLRAMGRLSQTCVKIHEIFRQKKLRHNVFICEILDRIITLIPTVKFKEEWTGGSELFQNLAKYHPALATHLAIQTNETFGIQSILRRLAKAILLIRPLNAEILLEALFNCAQGVSHHSLKIQTLVQIAEAFAPLNTQRANKIFEAAMKISKRDPHCTFRNEFLLIIQRQALTLPDQIPPLFNEAYEIAKRCDNPVNRSLLFSGLAVSLSLVDSKESHSLYLQSLDMLISNSDKYLISQAILKFLKNWDRRDPVLFLPKLRILLTEINDSGRELPYLPKIAKFLASFDRELADALFRRSIANVDRIGKSIGHIKAHIGLAHCLQPFDPEKASALLRKALDSVQPNIVDNKVQDYCKIARALFPFDPQKALEIFEKQIALFKQNMQDEGSFYDIVKELCLIDDEKIHPLLYQILELGHRLESYNSLVYGSFQGSTRRQFWEDVPFILQETQKQRRSYLMLKPVYSPENQISFLLRSLEVLNPDTDIVHAKLDRLFKHYPPESAPSFLSPVTNF
ncbi:MAG: hypothetical protein K1000chlam2_01082 [Chlamydiae bacterium]|nr:hypothetical protein [Chlamydiota bacterium]